MKTFPSAVVAFALLAASLAGADRVVVTVTNPGALARPAETVVMPFAEVRRVLPGVPLHHLLVREAATGAAVPSQVTNFHPDRHELRESDLVFQHDFAAGEATAKFVLEATAAPVPPYPAKVFARYVPERLDDFAWETDRIAHRIYGPGLETPAAGGSRMRSSGVDVWAKRVRYLIVDRWYTKGHDAYHTDTGEGLDTYAVGTGRGCGGTGVWDGQTLWTSANWATWKVLANGPVRAVFELTYAPWPAGPGVTVAETRRYTVDAGHNLDLIASTFTVAGAPEVTVALGVGDPPDARVTGRIQDETAGILGVWQEYSKTGSMGVGVVLAAPEKFAGFARGSSADDLHWKPALTNELLLVHVKNGDTVRFAAGAGWDRSGDFPNREAWEAHLRSVARRLAAPVTATIAVEPAP